ncbi:MAG: glycine zipper 2TM domain-containing protein [Gammaproteobacteria bacterium]|nr:glycine zipper 2TM domain-containing protein [Gammaproteobacteria bacterium]
MKLSYLTTLTLCGALTLTGCETTTINKQDVGALTGGVLGGVLGNQVHGSGRTAAIIGGTLAGALIGGSIGKTMDDVDKMKVNQTLESTPTNQTSAWTNPDSGTTYQVTPTKTYSREQGGSLQPCREFTTTALIGGKKQEIYGTACRQADGSWKTIQ